jgi:membrane peptidoglycan carboxypeptidase
LFINEVYLGHYNGKAVKGYENASYQYFNKSFKELTWDEYLSITAMIRAPLTFHYINCKETNIDRVAKIKRMLSGEYIPKENSDWLYDRE